MDLQEVTFKWSTEHGYCYDCGLPAAFRVDKGFHTTGRLGYCAICAANYAAEGYVISRIEELD